MLTPTSSDLTHLYPVYCVIVRVNRVTDRRECILVERKEEPVKGKWWFPGGRMYKGESFFKVRVRARFTTLESSDTSSFATGLRRRR